MGSYLSTKFGIHSVDGLCEKAFFTDGRRRPCWQSIRAKNDAGKCVTNVLQVKKDIVREIAVYFL